MKSLSYKHTHNVYQTDSNLGFFCLNEFEILDSQLARLTGDEVVGHALRSDLFSDRFIRPVIAPVGKNRKIPVNEHGPLLIDKVTIEDFVETDLSGLIGHLADYQRSGSWGVDLDPFKKLFAHSIEILESKSLRNTSIFYLNQESIEDYKKIEYNFFGYFISVIIPHVEENKIILVDYGSD